MDRRYLIVVFGTLFFFQSFISLTEAEEEARAMVKVVLTIDHTISIAPLDVVVDAGVLDTGDAAVPIVYRVDSNSENIALSAVVTNLYKADDPSSVEVEAIPVNLSNGVAMRAQHASQAAGGDGIASYVGTDTITTNEDAMEGYLTEELAFESSQNGRFSQDVEIVPTWTSADPEQPEGEYSGYVVVRAMVMDQT